MPRLRLRAPAKINLSFEVLSRRSDGYHEVRTVMQAVDLADELELEEAPAISLTVEPRGAAPAEDNLVLRAAELLLGASGVSRGASLTLRKRVPVAAGLGGASSDAAAALLGLRRLWALDVSPATLRKLAGRLGSDVPFFLSGGTALATGRGDRLTPLPQPVERFAVIASPPGPAEEGKTARMYALLTPRGYSDGGPTAEVARRIGAGEPMGEVPFNAFEAVAVQGSPSHDALCTRFREAGAHRALLCGAGPSMFALAGDEETARAIRDRVAGDGYRAYVARLLPAWGLDGLEAG